MILIVLNIRCSILLLKKYLDINVLNINNYYDWIFEICKNA
jgi:hypothetical protein